jgi:hypothetical protein
VLRDQLQLAAAGVCRHLRPASGSSVVSRGGWAGQAALPVLLGSANACALFAAHKLVVAACSERRTTCLRSLL